MKSKLFNVKNYHTSPKSYRIFQIVSVQFSDYKDSCDLVFDFVINEHYYDTDVFATFFFFKKPMCDKALRRWQEIDLSDVLFHHATSADPSDR